MKGVIELKKGIEYPRRNLLLKLEHSRYERNDTELKHGKYRIKGDTIDIFPSWGEYLIRLEFFGDYLEKIEILHPVSAEVLSQPDKIDIFPATHYLVHESMEQAIINIRQELDDHLNKLRTQGKIFEAHRLEKRTKYDLEMMQEIGYCKGIENYSKHISNRTSGDPPGVLLDFFPEDFITIIDESHVTLPQIRGMFAGDFSRKQNLIEYGFRLPSALDNRPLNFMEFEEKAGQRIYTSATPGTYEMEHCFLASDTYNIIEQIIRPTGLIDPEVILKPTQNQTNDLMKEIKIRTARNERVLITTITKLLAEQLCDYFDEKGLKVRYLHSDVKTLDRIDILHDLRAGKFDVLIGVNLLREGLDLPEVSLVAIMDADKEGFLRNERSLIQTIGRAARNINGKVILYADKLTDSISKAVKETNRRRSIQMDYNKKHNIQPQTIKKKLTDIREESRQAIHDLEEQKQNIKPNQLPGLIAKLEKDMHTAAKNLEFELAAVIRDQIEDLKHSKFI